MRRKLQYNNPLWWKEVVLLTIIEVKRVEIVLLKTSSKHAPNFLYTYIKVRNLPWVILHDTH